MVTAPCIPVPSPQNIQQKLFPNGVINPLSLPKIWSAQALLTPFGGLSSSAISPSDQLVIGNLTYETVSPSERLMRVSLYILESLYYYDFLFHTVNGVTNWWWLVSDPNTPNGLPTHAFGPFTTAANVPDEDFLRSNAFSHVGAWKVQGRSCNAFSASRGMHPDPGNPGNAIPNAATVLWFDARSNSPTRLMNIDRGNDFRIAILGAYYIVDLPSFRSLGSSNLAEVYRFCT